MNTILVGLDASIRSERVLAAALEMAEKYAARLVAIRAVGLPIEFPIEALTTSPEGLPARLLDLTQRQLEQFVARVPRERLDHVEARLGTPWQVLCDAAKEMDAGAIVIGTHGYSALDRIIGTTAARVVNHAPCSVFVVRNAHETDALPRKTR